MHGRSLALIERLAFLQASVWGNTHEANADVDALGESAKLSHLHWHTSCHAGFGSGTSCGESLLLTHVCMAFPYLRQQNVR